jgi:hypothetical protein
MNTPPLSLCRSLRLWRQDGRVAAFVLARQCSLGISAAAMLALVSATSAVGCANKPATATTAQSRTLVAYTEEQAGIVLRHTALIVSARGQATMKFERCVRRFQLGVALWEKLKTAQKQTNMHALAGHYGPATPRPEESSWVIVSGHDTVRITAFSIPSKLRAKMEPLLKVLDEVISVGKRGMPRSCAGKRAMQSTARDNGTSNSDR